MVKAMLNLANWGVEVFRLDSTAFLWKRLGTNCMNQVEAHWILQALRSIVQIATPAVVLKAEAIVPTADLPAYLGDQEKHIKECQIAYHSSLMAAAWMALAEQKTDVLRCVIERTPSLPQEATWLTYVRCHDDIGWNVLRAEVAAVSVSAEAAQQRLQAVSRFYSEQGEGFADGLRFQASDPQAVHGTVGMTASLCGVRGATLASNQMALRRILLMYALAMSFGGMPLLYMGDELAQINDRSYLDDIDRSHDGRWLQRPLFDVAAMNELESADQNSLPLAAYSGLRRLLGKRRQLAAFSAQVPSRLIQLPHSSVLAFVRASLDSDTASKCKPVLCLFNFSETEAVLDWKQVHDALLLKAGDLVSWERQQDLHLIGVEEDRVIKAASDHQIVLAAYAALWIS
jgi:amylosucrase